MNTFTKKSCMRFVIEKELYRLIKIFTRTVQDKKYFTYLAIDTRSLVFDERIYLKE
jgi:hypothetical protein